MINFKLHWNRFRDGICLVFLAISIVAVGALIGYFLLWLFKTTLIGYGIVMIIIACYFVGLLMERYANRQGDIKLNKKSNWEI